MTKNQKIKLYKHIFLLIKNKIFINFKEIKDQKVDKD